MTKDLEAFIQRLSKSDGSVRPLPDPWIRTAVWLALSVPYMALVVLMMSLRADLPAKLSEPKFVFEQIAALATGLTAAAAAFASILPGYPRKFIALPLLPLAVWVGSLGTGCIQDWIQLGPQGLALRPDWICFPATVAIGLAPALIMAVMLRRGAPLTPHLTTALGGLAAGGLGNFGLRLHHHEDASVMVLVWQAGVVFALTVLAGWAGGYLLNWRSIVARARRGAGLE
jgi:hypothetical protein